VEGNDQGGARSPSDGGLCSGSSIPAPVSSEALDSALSCQQDGDAARARNGAVRAPDPLDRPASERAYAALDLGTNNCRLLVARPSPRGFKVIDAFSRIIRLGEGVAATRRLSEEAMERTMDALRVCAAKMQQHNVARSGLIATEACRMAANAPEFLKRVRDEMDLDIRVVSREAEAKLAVSGCASLIDATSDSALVFDIGGGSSELIWLDLAGYKARSRRHYIDRLEMQDCIAAWTSLPVGVVTLAERYGGRFVDNATFDAMVMDILALLKPFEAKHRLGHRMANGSTHLLGTSGTVTTVAGVYLGLPKYDRRQVDGCWLRVSDARDVTACLLASTHAERIAQPCIGKDRADLVLAGCAILEALLRTWPCERLRVADRGLREGILATLMAQDGVYRTGGRQRYWKR
jgi:exopolyphosphatase/guanosine-5'-triphosphate,3'-diphosphate pyrophosphatase